MDLVSNVSGHNFNNVTGRKLKFSNFYWSAAQSKAYIESILRRKDSDWEAVLLIPLLATIILALTVFLIVLFRQNPVVVIGTVSSCIIFIVIYLSLSALESFRIILE